MKRGTSGTAASRHAPARVSLRISICIPNFSCPSVLARTKALSHEQWPTAFVKVTLVAVLSLFFFFLTFPAIGSGVPERSERLGSNRGAQLPSDQLTPPNTVYVPRRSVFQSHTDSGTRAPSLFQSREGSGETEAQGGHTLPRPCAREAVHVDFEPALPGRISTGSARTAEPEIRHSGPEVPQLSRAGSASEEVTPWEESVRPLCSRRGIFEVRPAVKAGVGPAWGRD